ncbi:hypothetical protein [Bradyrhizobium sp. LHD-71]|uniref:hypothetical protein n=1 Tax=Bradyrhizobium sp. LHD-71 TaxID=3072141 RepID=UPI00281026A7|nr:hypothetical protein [Bradyrhizobium sp. LHD-71]MDQ8729489.1 hypothetical protein [Bradyrhizobium sp. LHD-71]
MSAKQPPPPDIPIVFCKACNKAPMIAKTIREHAHGADIELTCPNCGATIAEKLPASTKPDS